jgi:hypothetical protein
MPKPKRMPAPVVTVIGSLLKVVSLDILTIQ